MLEIAKKLPTVQTFSLSPRNSRQRTGMEIIKSNLMNSSIFKYANNNQTENLERSFDKLLDSPKARKMLIEIVYEKIIFY